MSKARSIVMAIACLCLSAPGSGRAQTQDETPAQREARLLAAAKGEGELLVYSTAPPEDNKALTDAFEARYGIPVKLWRGSSEDILQRALAEAAAGRRLVDALINTGVGLETMHRESLLQRFDSPLKADLIPEAVLAHGEWTGFYLAPVVQFANLNAIRKADLPKSFDDLANPRWKDKLAVEAADSDWFQAVVENIGRDRGLALFHDIASRNRVSVRRGHSLIANLVTAGEVPLALTVYQFTAQQMKARGAPVEWFTLGPSMAAQVGVGIVRDALHPAAAALFHDFLIGHAQDLLSQRDFVASRKDIFAKASFPMKVQDAAATIDGAGEWEALFKKTFNAR